MFAQSILYVASAAMFFPAPRESAPDDKGRGFFGVQLVDNGGVSITRVEPDSPADKADREASAGNGRAGRDPSG
jgi:hypothetical protein